MPALYDKIGHLPGSRTGPKDRHVGFAMAERFTAADRGERVLVEEKLDGSCVAVVRTTAALTAFGREGRPCASSRNDGRRAFAAWLARDPARFDFLADGERLVGEWLALAHGTRYALPHGPFVAFDLFRDGQRISRDELGARLAGRLPQPRLLHDGPPLAGARALELLGEHGHHGALEPAEGVIYRLHAGSTIHLAKLVRHGKRDGVYLADHSGAGHVWNTWHDGDA